MGGPFGRPAVFACEVEPFVAGEFGCAVDGFLDTAAGWDDAGLLEEQAGGHAERFEDVE